jgi:hypothetical protein
MNRPPDRPQYPGWDLIDDAYEPEPEPVSRWDTARRRWAEAENRPVSHLVAKVVVLLCLCLFLATLYLLVATPRSAAVIPSPDRAWTVGESDQPRSGAPLMAASPAVTGSADPAPSATPVPSPTGAVSSLVQAEATWCKPTPKYCQGWGGKATVGAVYGFTWGDEPYWVRVEYRGKKSDVLIVSHCACNNSHGYIDLSPYAFEKLAPLWRGRIDVTVRSLDVPPDQHPDDLPAHPDDDRMRDEVRELPATDAEDPE